MSKSILAYGTSTGTEWISWSDVKKENEVENTAFPVTSILAGTDLGTDSRGVLFRAAQLSQQFGARLTALHVIETNGNILSPTKYQEQAKATLDTELTRTNLGNVHVKSHVRKGVPGPLLMKEMHDHRTDVSVLGFHHERSLDPVTLGSTMRHVLIETKKDVLLTVPSASQAYQSVLVSWDGEKPLAPALQRAQYYAPRAKLSVFMNVPLQEAIPPATTQIQTQLTKAGFDPKGVKAIVTSGPITDALYEAIQNESCDLMILPTRGNQNGDLGYMASQIIAHRFCDTLCCQESCLN
ncbi:MAG: universal stress protein [Pseudomonadota bacterium]